MALLCRARCVPSRTRHRVVERGEGELVLAREVVVDAALLETRGGDELAERRAGVAALVEDGRRTLEDPLAGQLALARPAPRGALGGRVGQGGLRKNRRSARGPTDGKNRPFGLIMLRLTVPGSRNGDARQSRGTVPGMCGRFVVVSSPALLAERFDVDEVAVAERRAALQRGAPGHRRGRARSAAATGPHRVLSPAALGARARRGPRIPRSATARSTPGPRA